MHALETLISKEVNCVNERKIMVLVLIVMLYVSSCAVLSANNALTEDYVFEAEVVNGQWTIKDTQALSTAGEPILPYRTARILLPQGALVKDVSVKHSQPIVQEGFDFPWGQPPLTSNDTPTVLGRNETTYASDNWYPGKLFEVVSTEYFRGFQILYVNLYPLQYQPKSGTVSFYAKLTVEVQYERGEKHALYRGLKGDKEDVSTLVDNPRILETYEEGETPPDTHEYIIITNATLTPVFQTLADHKAHYLSGVGVYDVAWIYSHCAGRDNAEKVRTFIKDRYENHGTRWCLLGGDISVVPYRGFYASAGGYTDTDIAADMYFGCLDGTFNDDNDNYWAEPTDGVDWLEEVLVGRAPVETVEEAEVFVNKVISYELAPRKKVCQFHAAGTGMPDVRQIAWDCEYWTPQDYVKKELFETQQPVTKKLWREAWDGTFDGEPHYPPVMFQHAGSGSTDCYYLGSSVTWYSQDVSSLTNNTFWPVHTSVASYSGSFTVNDCLAEAYVKDDCGAIACYFNDSLAWSSYIDASKYSGDFLETEFRALFSDGKEKLGELLNQAKSYWVSAAQTNSVYRWCYYEINLTGDPESPVLTQRLLPCTIEITHPSEGEEVYGKVAITTSVTGCIDTVEFYVDDKFLYTDTAAPFDYTWDTYGYAEDKEHTILVKGYCEGVYKAEDKITVTVNNVYLKITSPQPGETVSGMVTITTEVRGCDRVEFSIDGLLQYTDTSPPFQCEWDTKGYPDGKHTITVKGYVGGMFVEEDVVTCYVKNSDSCFKILLVFLSALL